MRTARLFAAAALLALAATPAHAWVAPRWSGTLGATTAVQGDVDGGGASLSLAATWPVGARYAVGVVLSADDLGTNLGRLRDPNDGSDLGATALGHRWAWGGAWRFDAAAAPRAGFRPYGSATLGWYRVADDVRGRVSGATSSTGMSLGLGADRPVGARFAAGASLRWHRLFNDRSRGWLSAGIDWSWR